MYGYAGKLLIVDLSSGEISAEPLNAKYAAQYIGGAGIAARYLYDAIDARTDPLGADNPLIFMTGPLAATAAPSAGRFVVVARSPLTGLYGEANAGNFFGPELKRAGYDGILVRGKSPTPVYLLIRDGAVELREANHLRGKTTFETGDLIRADTGDPKLTVAAIGPAGENLVKYALILATNARPSSKKGIAGRCGMGAVMGSKNLKAIAVRGTLGAPTPKIALHDPVAFMAAVRAALEMLPDDMSTQMFRATGTAGGMDYLGMIGDTPAKYWTQGTFDWEKISGNTLTETLLAGHASCHACLVACGRKVPRAAGHALPHAEGPEYETLAAFGSLMLVDNLEAATYLGSQCDALGLDAISAGSTIAFAMLLREQGIIGDDLRWGDAARVEQLVQLIARREGIGDALAEGTRALGARYGVEGLAVQVNGLEPAMHDPRALAPMALVYATSPIGASHNQSDYYWVEPSGRVIEEWGIVAGDRFETLGKAASIAKHQDWRSITSSLAQCIFPNPPVQTVIEMLAAATGYPMTLENALTWGERIWNLKRALNLKLGYNARASERLPELLMRGLADSGSEGHVVELEPMLREYYAARDWDWATGKPRRAKLLALDLPEVAGELWG